MKYLISVIAITVSFGSIAYAANPYIFTSAQVGASPVNTYCLTTDGTNSTWAPCSSGGGSGTISTSSPLVSGQSVYATGVDTIASAANMLWDNATSLLSITGNASTTQFTSTGNAYLATIGGKVGIGMTNPAAKLQISGGTTSFYYTTTDYAAGTTGSGLQIYTGANTGDTYSILQAYKTGATAYGNIALNALGGNVGIGTTTPSDILEINTSTANRGLKIVNTDPGASGVNVRLFHNSASPATDDVVGQFAFNGNSSSLAEATYGQIRSVIESPSSNGSGALTFLTAATGSVTEKLRVTSAGYIGIGTTSPIFKTQITSTNVGGGTTPLLLQNFDSTTNTAVSLGLSPFGGTPSSKGALTSTRTGGGTYSLALQTEVSGVLASRLTVGDTGNVGIGTTSPAALLSVGGNFFVGASTAGGTNGKLGVGIASPEQALDIRGQSQFIDTSGYNNRAIVIGRSTADAAAKSSAVTSRHWLNTEEPMTLIGSAIDDATNSYVNIGGGYSNNNSATVIRFYTAADNITTTGTTRMVINSAGNVGIGTTTPGSLLSVGNTNGINFSTATSTFSSTGGINLASGCFAIAGTCIGGGGSGTVTSVAMTVPTGLAISGSPITTSGTLALSLDANYNIPLTASTTNWNSAYDNRITSINNDTNVTGSIGSNAITLGWTGTLADSRIASAATWNAKQASLSLVAGTYTDGLICTYASTGTQLNCNNAGTISGVFLGNDLSTLSATNSSLTFSGTYNGGTNRTVGLNMGNANTWTALQTFANASSTQIGSTGNAYFATSAGSVGIGSTTPFAKLSIGADGAITTTEKTLATSTSMTVDWRSGNQQLVRVGTSATSIGFSNYVAGQTLRLVICSPGGTRGAVTFTGVLWPAGTAPTLTTTANKCDIAAFIATNATSSLVIMGGSNLNY